MMLIMIYEIITLGYFYFLTCYETTSKITFIAILEYTGPDFILQMYKMSLIFFGNSLQLCVSTDADLQSLPALDSSSIFLLWHSRAKSYLLLEKYIDLLFPLYLGNKED